MIRAVEEDIIPPTYIPTVLGHWRDPQYADFEERNLYTLYNCFTESFKKSPADTPNRTRMLTNMLDAGVPIADARDYLLTEDEDDVPF